MMRMVKLVTTLAIYAIVRRLKIDGGSGVILLLEYFRHFTRFSSKVDGEMAKNGDEAPVYLGQNFK
jgi:hypothetical protein